MAALVLGTAGAVAGSFFGPAGASIGWALLSTAGSLLFPGKAPDGPRLTDLKVQDSAYGWIIPTGFGKWRQSGCVHDSAPEFEEQSQSSGGKGGGPTQTTFQYFWSGAIIICEGEISGVAQIYEDSRLVYDKTISDLQDYPFTLYRGTETQIPDPTLEAIHGAGEVSAYRGSAYIVFDRKPLADNGNRLPLWSFVVYKEEGAIPWRVSEFTPTQGFGSTIENGEFVVGTYGTSGANEFPYDVSRYTLDGVLIIAEPTIYGFNVLAGSPQNPHLQALNDYHFTFAQSAGAGNFSVTAFYEDAVKTAGPIPPPPFGGTPMGADAYAVYKSGIMYEDNYYATGGLGLGDLHVGKWSRTGGLVAFYDLPFAGDAGDVFQTLVDDTNGDVYVVGPTSTPQMWKFTNDLELVHTWAAIDMPPGLDGVYSFVVWGGILLYSEIVSLVSLQCYRIEGDYSFTLLAQDFPGISGNVVHLGAGLCLVGDGIVSLVPPAVPAILGDIVSALSRMGSNALTADQIDVTELTDEVPGVLFASLASKRSCIEALMPPWPFDAVEHDVVVKFVRRNVNRPFIEIPDRDLGAYAYPGEPPAAMVTERAQETELPRHIDVKFINLDTDFQDGSQPFRRISTTSQLRIVVDLPVVLTDKKAKSVAQTLGYDAWTERERFKLQLPRKWLLLEPTDPIQALGRKMRAAHIVYGDDGVIKVDAPATNLQVYLQASVAAPGTGMPGGGGTPPTLPPVAQDTDLILIDGPLVNDTDEPNGYYVAAAGALRPSWPGYALFKSIDNGLSYSQLLTQTTPDTFGTATTALGGFLGGNVFDHVNVATVVLSAGSGPLASVTQLAVLNGANAAAWGVPGRWEYLQFATAHMTALRTYDTSDYLRGRRGTEWAMGLHQVGDRFVLLPTSTNINGSWAELGLLRHYRAVTLGQTMPGSGGGTSALLNEALRYDVGLSTLSEDDDTWYLYALQTSSYQTVTGGRNVFTDVLRATQFIRNDWITRGSSHGGDTSILTTYTGVWKARATAAANYYSTAPVAGSVYTFTNNGVALTPYSPVLLGGGRNGADDILLHWRRRTRIGGEWFGGGVDVPLSEASELYKMNYYDDSSYTTIALTRDVTTQADTVTAAEQAVGWGGLVAPLYWDVAQYGSHGLGTVSRGVT